VKANAAAIPDAGATNIEKVSAAIWDITENDCSIEFKIFIVYILDTNIMSYYKACFIKFFD
jgi:hypothetical protein